MPADVPELSAGGGEIRESLFVEVNRTTEQLYALLDEAVAEVRERAGDRLTGFVLIHLQEMPDETGVVTRASIVLEDWAKVLDAIDTVRRLNEEKAAETRAERRRRLRAQQ